MGVTPPGDTFPLSLEQEWFYAARLLQPGHRMSLSLALDIRGPLDVGVFLESVRVIFERHPGLRVRLAFTDRGEPRQTVVAPGGEPPVTCQAITGASRQQFDGYVRRVAGHDLRSRWNPVKDSLCRLRLLRHASDEHVFLATFDQLAFDHRALQIFERDLWQAYRKLRGDPALDLPAGSDLASSVLRQRSRYERPAGTANARYWPGQYALAPPVWQPSAPLHRLRPAGERGVIDYAVAGELAEKLRDTCHSAKCTPFMMCVAVFALLAFHLTRQDRLAIYIAMDMREDSDKSVIGMFTGIRPLVVDRAGNGSSSLVSQVRDQVSRALACKHVPGQVEMDMAILQRSPWRLEPRRALLVDYIGDDSREAAGAGPAGLNVAHAGYAAPSAAQTASLALSVLDTGKDLRVSLHYDTTVISDDDAELRALLETEFAQVAGTRGGQAPGVQPLASAVDDPALSPLHDSQGAVCLHVDLAEVRAAILGHPAIADARVWVDSNAAGGSEVVASIANTASVTDEELQQFCLSWPNATQYMVPPRTILRRAPE